MKKNKKIDKKLVITFTIFVISIVVFLVMFMKSESDYYWHIKAGEYMFHNGILKRDVFSWYLSGTYWMSHEWLSEIILYSFKCIFPTYHLLVYGFVFMSSLLLILFFANKDSYLKNIHFSMIWVTFSALFISFMQGRPHLISFNLLALTLWFLYDTYRNEDSKLIYFLPLVTIIWANVHGGSSNLSYLLCFIFLIVGLFNFERSKVVMHRISKKQIIKYLVVALVCMLCININIHGFKMFIYPYQNMMDKTMLSNVTEWFPTNLNNPDNWPYLCLVVFIFFVLLLSKKKIDFMDLALFGIAVVLGFKSIRFWSYTYIFMSFVVCNYVEKKKIPDGIYGVLIIVSIAFIGLFVSNWNLVNKQLNEKYLDDGVITKIKEEKPERLFNMYNYGGELIYNDIPVFIDGRADLYSKYNYQNYLRISISKPDYVSLIKLYKFDYFLVDKDFPISTYLQYNPDYINIYDTQEFALYKKTVN
ncbi:MAG: hypothetical protein IJI58_00565 [Bacilli bacterium]|nr:hypothetical protein [Bacilli bacterium]